MNTSQRFPLKAVAALTACAILVTACGGLPSGPTSLTDKDNARIAPVMSALTQPEQDAFKRLYLEGERNAVLNFQTLGIAALEAGHYTIAERAFEEAVQRIERFYTDDPNVRKAKSTFTTESIKDFKGEPYERAMAFYYRGLLYLRAGDYQNARASFLKADFQDTVAEKEQYQGDFGVMTYLAGWASACDGDTNKARELIEAGAQKDPNLRALPTQAKTLVIVEAGAGPVKVGEGKHRELLTVQDRPDSQDSPVALSPVRDGTGQFVKVADIVYQGTTRGGRPIQGILDGKAKFKDTTEAVGSAALTTGTTAMQVGALSGNNDMFNAGAAIGLIGAIASIAADAAKPAADVRYWPNLPRDIYMSTMQDDSVPQAGYAVDYTGPDGATRTAHVKPLGSEGTCTIAWGRTRTTTDVSGGRKVEGASSPKDEAFRQKLVEEFRVEEGKA